MLIRGLCQPMPSKSRPDQSPERRKRPGPSFQEEGLWACLFSLRLGRKSRLLTENIPDAPGGVNKLGVPGVALDLLAEVSYVHVDRALVAELVAPYARQERAPRENPARVGGERY